MDAELKAKWVAALRGGKYEQTKHMLNDGVGYCCLGVLCNVVGAYWKHIHEDHPVPFLGNERLEHEDEYYLSPAFAERCGLTYLDQERLAHLNDGFPLESIEPHSFSEIADYIEKNL